MQTYKVTLSCPAETCSEKFRLVSLLFEPRSSSRDRVNSLIAELHEGREVVIHGLSHEEAAMLIQQLQPLGVNCSVARDDCPVCGSPITRVLTGLRAYIGPKQRIAIDSGCAILGPDDPTPTPDSVCLTCSPEWREIHQLALRLYDCQLAKEHAVADQDFDKARSLRDEQYELQPRLEALLKRIRGGL